MSSKASRKARGSISLITALGLVALAGFGALAVDYGYLQWKRSQLQAAVDVAALAGAAGLVSFGGDMERIRAEAVRFGRANIDARDNPNAALGAGDVTVNLVSPGWVEVRAGLTAGRGNPAQLFLGRILGRETSDVTATARAQTFCSTVSRCIKPWTVPTKFTWDDNCGAAKYRNGVLDVDVPCEMSSINVLGYSVADVGTRIVLKTGDPHSTIAPGQYSPVDLPPANQGQPVSGGSAYRDNIAGCTGGNSQPVSVNDFLQLEPGNMIGPTKQGIQELIAQDPDAYWDTASKAIKGSIYPDPLSSPRVGIITFFDPRDPPTSGRNTIQIYQLGAVFVEGIDGNSTVTGRFVNTTAVDPVRGAGGNCGTLWGVSLVRDSTR